MYRYLGLPMVSWVHILVIASRGSRFWWCKRRVDRGIEMQGGEACVWCGEEEAWYLVGVWCALVEERVGRRAAKVG
jgi:hypothetical protein